MKNPRMFFVLALLSVVFILGASIYLQFSMHLELCGLCISQRVLFLIMALILCAAIVHQRHARAYASLIIIFSLAGIYFAGRQVWLEHLPKEQLPGCGPNLSILLTHFPMKAARELFVGSAECGSVVWQFLGLSLAAWSLFCFIALLGFGIRQSLLKKGI
jgi:disulfide bond formation protein DsbB